MMTPLKQNDVVKRFRFNLLSYREMALPRFEILTFILIALLAPFYGPAQELPPIRNFYPKDYNGENQNWAISQSADKLIYVANSGGLLEFNGADWKRYPSPNESIVRSVQVIEDRIYMGCYMEFGFWEKEESGTLRYTSISQTLSTELINDEEFWNIVDMEDWIVFQSLKRIYIYNLSNALVTTIDSNSSITKVYKIDEQIYFQKMGLGIYRIEQGKEILVVGDDVVKENKVINIFGTEKELLILTEKDGFYTWKEEILEKSNFSSNDLLSNVSIYDAIRLENNSFMIGTIAHGLVHLNEKGDIRYQMDQTSGLSNNTVLALFEDIENNIWLGLDNGISYANSKAPFQVFNDDKGVLGSIYASEVSNGNLYLGTNQGLFFRKFDSSDDFSFIPGTYGQVWALVNIDGTLFCGHNSGTFIIKGDKAQKISNIQGTWNIAKLPNTSDLLLQGNYDGLYVLEKSDNVWKLRNKIEGFDNSARYFETLTNEIFVNHEYQGVFKLKVDPSFSKVQEVVIDTMLKGSNSGILKYKGNLLYAYKNGVFKYDRVRKGFVKDTLISRSYTDEEYESGKLIWDKKDDKLWIFTKSNIGYITPAGLSNTPKIKNIPLPKEIRAGILGYENISRLVESDQFLIGTTSGYITIDLGVLKDKDFQVHIGSVINGVVKPIKDLDNKKTKDRFKTNENNIEISFYSPEYNKYLETNYQYQLLGIYDDWSTWSKKSRASFENLPHGNYTFNVRAKIGNTLSTNEATYSFEIARPWYASKIMVVFYVLGLFLISFLTHSAYKRHYNKKHQELVEKNKKGLELIRVQSEKEIIKIKNNRLKAEFKSKSHDLAASLMSITKKNELLTRIKAKLNEVQDGNSVKSIVKLIDGSLKQNDDWEFFQEAFNHADSEFLQNAKNLHPSLSPNDLKLCAYLRLNLSTKEMAKLLSITPRSVEIKRYRLRKKLKLKHEDNLASYILSI